MTLRTLNYGNYGIFLIMGTAGFCPSAVSYIPCPVSTPYMPKYKLFGHMDPYTLNPRSLKGTLLGHMDPLEAQACAVLASQVALAAAACLEEALGSCDSEYFAIKLPTNQGRFIVEGRINNIIP